MTLERILDVLCPYVNPQVDRLLELVPFRPLEDELAGAQVIHPFRTLAEHRLADGSGQVDNEAGEALQA